MLQKMSSRLRGINQKLMELVASGAITDDVSKALESFRDETAYSHAAEEKP